MKRSWVEGFLPLILLGVLGLLWEGAVHVWSFPHYILPGPWRIIGVMWTKCDLLAFHAVVTLGEIGLGFLVALVVGIALSLAIHASRIVERTLPQIPWEKLSLKSKTRE